MCDAIRPSPPKTETDMSDPERQYVDPKQIRQGPTRSEPAVRTAGAHSSRIRGGGREPAAWGVKHMLLNGWSLVMLGLAAENLPTIEQTAQWAATAERPA